MTDALSSKGDLRNDFREVERQTRVIDSETLLQQTFRQDPRQGCALLFRLEYGTLCSHAIRFVYSKEVAEDIVADVFCRFWEDRIFERINVSYRAYLFKAVRHRAYNYVKFELSKQTSEEESAAGEACAGPDDILEYDELSQLLEDTINGLPQQCKKVFVLSRREHKTYHDIAAELDVSLKAIEAHVSKALRILRKKLNDDWNWK